MIREVDLVSYMPPFMADFKEITATLKAENPEFILIWKATDWILKNEYLETADEYGISRLEKIMDILPSKEDSLENRRTRVQVRLFNKVPYILKVLILKLMLLCGGDHFKITKQYDLYSIKIETQLETLAQIRELERIIETIIPCNMLTLSENILKSNLEGTVFIGGTVSATECFFITNDFTEEAVVKGGAFGVSSVCVEIIGI